MSTLINFYSPWNSENLWFLVISEGIEISRFIQIWLIFETKLGDDLLSTNQTGWIFPSRIIQSFSDKSISGITAIFYCLQHRIFIWRYWLRGLYFELLVNSHSCLCNWFIFHLSSADPYLWKMFRNVLYKPFYTFT